MALGLDLRPSWAKHARALELLAVINSSTRASLRAQKPFALHTELDSESGWLSIKLHPQPPNLALSVLVGEFVHDLRSGLDYIVTALVSASGALLSTRHQFPIVRDQSAFDKALAPHGALSGVKYGLDELRALQPFDDRERPEGAMPALSAIQRLSNSDKHRSMLVLAPYPESHALRVKHDGRILEQRQPDPLQWDGEGSVEIQRIRFARPYPTLIDPEVDLELKPAFLDPPFPPAHPDPALYTLEALGAMAEQVAHVIDIFQCL